MKIVALVVVGGVLLLLVGLFAWSGVRGLAGARVRGAIRDVAGLDLPHGLEVGLQEPQALRAAFALTGVGDVVDIAQAWLGTFRGGQLGLVDLHVRLGARGVAPVAHTIVTIDVDQQWPWTRVRRADAPVVTVDVPHRREVEGVVGTWLVESAASGAADDVVGEELLAWLDRFGRPVAVEFTPRHVLVSVTERVADADLAAFVALAVGVVDQVPVAVRERWLPASDPDELPRLDAG